MSSGPLGAAIFDQVTNAWFDIHKEPVVAEIGDRPRSFLLEEDRQHFEPDIAVMHLAEEVLKPFEDLELPLEPVVEERPEGLERIPKALGSDPHLVVFVHLRRVREGGGMEAEPVDPDHGLEVRRVVYGRRVMIGTLAPEPDLQGPESPGHLLEKVRGLHGVEQRDHIRLEPLPLLLKPQEEALDPLLP